MRCLHDATSLQGKENAWYGSANSTAAHEPEGLGGRVYRSANGGSNDVSAVLRFQFALAILVAALMVPLDGQAQTEAIDDGSITVVQPRGFLRRHRVEVAPKVSWLFGDPYVKQLGVGGTINYSPTKRVFFGGTFEWYDFAGAIDPETDRFEEVVSTTLRVPNKVVLDWSATGEVSWVPIIGKFTLFNRSIVWFDLYLTIGGGVVSDDGEIAPAGVLAAGVHTYFNEWFGMSFEIRDRLSIQEVANDETIVWNSTSATVGFHFFLPFKAEPRIERGGEDQ
jgi:outer membrane beta-barrel protein